MGDVDTSNDERISRRQYAQILAGMGTAALAGCPSGGDNTATAGGDGVGDDDAGPTDTPGEGDGGTPTDEPTGETGTDRQPVRDTIRIAVTNSPDVFDWNPWTPQDNTSGDNWMSELNGLTNVHTPENAYSGTTVPTPHKPDHDEVELMTWIEEWTVEEPYDWRHHLDDRASFWNGDPYDAPTLVTHNHVAWFFNGNKFTEGETFNEEAEDQWTRHGWFDRGEVPEQDENPVAKPVLEAQAKGLLFNPPLHPDYTEPYLERFQDAGSSDEVGSISDDLTSDRVSLQRVSEEGWGSGMYVLESVDDIGSESATLRLDDEHPNAGHTNVEKLELLWAESSRRQTLASNGDIDLNGGIVAPSADYNRETLPDHVQELTRWLNATLGTQWLMNWHNPHLQRLWVRRALVEAVDWNAVVANGWGQQTGRTTTYDTFLMDAESESTFSSDFLDRLHTYSRAQNLENATQYMQNAGYSRQGGQWVDPDGNAASIDLIAPSSDSSYIEAAQSIKANLSQWGFGVNFSSQGFSTWSNNLNPEGDGLNFDTSIFWSDTATVFGKYNDRGAWWGEALLGGSPSAGSVFRLTEDDERDTQNKPVVVELPEEVGSIDAPDEAGIAPDLENGREVDMLEVVDAIREPGKSEEAIDELYRTCAQYYNFYLPDFVFAQSISGAWGNVRDFDWPGPDERALDYARNVSIPVGTVMTGLAQASYDTDFQSPE
ncbi:ABC transporter substrate-binding protein [Halosimplex amylolyticum]|uniref:ABC transporter substrate-binding protein n=1 Tax=Halosimplex amylolyticum TaxID=3396616 RepID=UPI003F572405